MTNTARIMFKLSTRTLTILDEVAAKCYTNRSGALELLMERRYPLPEVPNSAHSLPTRVESGSVPVGDDYLPEVCSVDVDSAATDVESAATDVVVKKWSKRPPPLSDAEA